MSEKKVSERESEKEISEREVVELMLSSCIEDDWNARCAIVKAAFGGGYPDFWIARIVMGGVARIASEKWGGTDEIQITAIR